MASGLAAGAPIHGQSDTRGRSRPPSGAPAVLQTWASAQCSILNPFLGLTPTREQPSRAEPRARVTPKALAENRETESGLPFPLAHTSTPASGKRRNASKKLAAKNPAPRRRSCRSRNPFSKRKLALPAGAGLSKREPLRAGAPEAQVAVPKGLLARDPW